MFNRLSFGVNMLGGHCMPWATALIPAETELEHSYSELCKASNAATKRILTLPNYGCKDCQTCSYIKELNDNQLVSSKLLLPSCDANAMRISVGSISRWATTIPVFKTFAKRYCSCRRAFAILTYLPFLPTMGHSRSASNSRCLQAML